MHCRWSVLLHCLSESLLAYSLFPGLQMLNLFLSCMLGVFEAYMVGLQRDQAAWLVSHKTPAYI